MADLHGFSHDINHKNVLISKGRLVSSATGARQHKILIMTEAKNLLPQFTGK